VLVVLMEHLVVQRNHHQKVAMVVSPDLLVRLQYLQLVEVAVDSLENLVDLVVAVDIKVNQVVMRLLVLAVILVEMELLVQVLLMEQVAAVVPVELELMAPMLKVEMVDWEDKFQQHIEILHQE
jgi:hypothetical protein|tara:strand:+ start:484 stop:855 length:372 start_codon:yes stop_codon:yes gene_type:complete